MYKFLLYLGSVVGCEYELILAFNTKPQGSSEERSVAWRQWSDTNVRLQTALRQHAQAAHDKALITLQQKQRFFMSGER